ncbi:hypothetical protein ALI144C_07770 [Actinosynnema sp. ALI-1.44]|uniref:response regulator transcription factor n=1 Tax=Actinosynnema sp. ALI-1.44 TaxID=1933779 RepID=UPI00097C703D|nr:LuxR C-terminal-related transcriptional regulator [Actinosynnema sp. ALI-1.44]ONI87833.1 hypothetical protein ALI144C_07770 [Actinosynnema sp. ALI-1.44]
MKVTNVVVVTSDPLLRNGATVLLGAQKAVCVLPESELARADVVLLLEARTTRNTLSKLGPVGRNPTGNGPRSCVVVTDDFNEDDLLTAVLLGVTAVIPLRETGGPQLLNAVLAAHKGIVSMPPVLQRKLLALVQDVDSQVLRPNGLMMSGLTERECDVLRLLIEGLNTEQIAGKLAYSDRTVKNVLHRVMKRHGLRNRAHAAAYAVRACVC